MRWGIAVALAGSALAAGPARAEVAAVDVPIVDEHGAPVFCTRDETHGRARPDAAGGYHLAGLRPGRWIVSLDLPHERVDVLVSLTAGEEVVIPPVVARGRCQRLSLLRRPDVNELVGSRPSTWQLRFGRTYRAAPGAAGDKTAERFVLRGHRLRLISVGSPPR